MIVAYIINEDGEFEKRELSPSDKFPQNVVWIDLLEPTLEEERYIEKSSLGIETLTREEMDRIEVMSPFYKEDDAYYMTVTAVHKADTDYPESTALSFILHSKCLVTLRYSRPKAFHYFSSRAMRHNKVGRSPEAILEGLIEALVHSLADVLEKTGNEIDQLLVDVFEKPTDHSKLRVKRKGYNRRDESDDRNGDGHYYTELIKKVGRTGNLISKIRESLVSFSRMLIFFGQIEDSIYIAKKEHRARFRNLTREVHSLTEYANFLSSRNSFLLDATLGMLNVEQNKIIKVFTVAAVLFMPPTLIASNYGMNFHIMPELSLSFGYPMALVLMFISAFIPYQLFKHKGWF